MRRLSPIRLAPLLVLLLASLPATQLACSPATDDAQDAIPAEAAGVVDEGAAPASAAIDANAVESPSDETTHSRPTTGATITASNLFENEKSWPNISALVEPWTPPGASAPLKKGYRGAVIRVLEERRVRIDFGRHGEHEIPIAATDVVLRANEVEAGTSHKVAPNFLAHFGTQFVHPSRNATATTPQNAAAATMPQT